MARQELTGGRVTRGRLASAPAVGAGLGGLSVASRLHERGVDVCLVDRGGPGAGASAANGGFVLIGHASGYPAMRRRLGRMPDRPAEPPEPDPAAWSGRTVFVVAGEASGDLLAARVVKALKDRCPDVRVRGYAGPKAAAGSMGITISSAFFSMPGAIFI